jgi:predicted pyridoxine 5'-phosphate oxidase superfamily flavin-nucleotide-binding protein
MTLRDTDSLEAAVGGTPDWAMGKVITELDAHALRWVGSAPLVAVAIDGPPVVADLLAVTEFVGATPHEIAFRALPMPTPVSAERPAGTLWMLPGIDDTLRVNGSLRREHERLVVAVDSAFFHCAKAFKRSGLWASSNGTAGDDPHVADAPSWEEVVANSTFALLATSNGDSCHISPRGDPAGALFKVIGGAVFLAERPGNRMAACMHQILERQDVSLLVLSAPRSTTVTIRGRATLHTDIELRAMFRHNGRDPRIVIAVEVIAVEVSQSAALDRVTPFDPSVQARRRDWPSLAQMMGDQMAGGSIGSSELENLEQSIAVDYRDNLY